MDYKNFQKLEARHENIIWIKGSIPAVRDGWVPIIEDLVQDISEIVGNEEFVVNQVKEKFGGLRFYYEVDQKFFPEILPIVQKAEEESFKTCEICGEPGELISHTPHAQMTWMKTLCERCKER
jgi:hypothetical protein